MNFPSALMVGVVTFILAVPAWSAEAPMTHKLYECQGQKFEVSEPQDGRMAVMGMGLTASITVHKATGMYREGLGGWESDHNTLEGALDRACKRILEKAKKPSNDALLKGLDDLYESLKWPLIRLTGNALLRQREGETHRE